MTKSFGLLLLLGCLCPLVAFGEVHFAQLTDPHLFDPGQEATNEQLFQWCIDCINTNASKGVHYAFVVVTGDLGVEKLAKVGATNSSGQQLGAGQKEMARAIETFAKHLNTSQVKRWLFVPGNNDLLEENPHSILSYRTFIHALADRVDGSGILVKDLTPREGDPFSGYEDQTATADGTNLLRFIGFNNASFKGNDRETDAKDFEDEQLKEIHNVEKLIPSRTRVRYRGTFIFYHIPEIEDPYWDSFEADNPTLKDHEAHRGDFAKHYPRSAWTVTQKVRDEWMGIVTNDRVHGLFAGHFHSPNRAVYEGFGWMLDPTNYTATLQKLLIAPPIAIKKQDDKPVPARGYREVSIDGETGTVVETSAMFYDPPLLKPEGSGAEQHTSTISGWDMLMNFVLVPCFVLLIFAGVAWGMAVVFRKSRFANSGPAHTTMLMVALDLGAIVIGFAALGTLAHCKGTDICHVVGVGALWSLAALGVGGALGILFGTPRSPNLSKDGVSKPKTILEEMADWLSKLIVGGTLFESRNIAIFVETAGRHFAATVSNSQTGLWSGVGSALLIYFTIVGFFGAYFPMRLYLARAIEDAESGRSVVSDRTGLPQTMLDALEAAPLSVEQTGNNFGGAFDGIALEAAKEIGAIPLESLTNWQDVRLWAKAKLSQGEIDSAINAYQKAIEIVPNDAETRLGYATALSVKKASKQVILTQLEMARNCLMNNSPRDLRKNVFKSLAYQCLYLKRPESFVKTLKYANEYFDDPQAIDSGGLWINVACAYGQAYAWRKENEKNEIDLKDLLVSGKQDSPEGNLLDWLRAQALMASKVALAREPEWQKTLLGLLGEDPRVSPDDQDLEPFKNDREFRKLAGLSPVIEEIEATKTAAQEPALKLIIKGNKLSRTAKFMIEGTEVESSKHALEPVIGVDPTEQKAKPDLFKALTLVINKPEPQWLNPASPPRKLTIINPDGLNAEGQFILA